MANRYLNQFQLTYEKDSVSIYGQISVGSSGAVSSGTGGGITSITKQATAGQYTVLMTNSYDRLLHARASIVNATATSVATVQILQDPATIQADIQSTRQLKFQCLDFAGSAVNPPSGSQLEIVIVMRNSSIGPYDND